ncbi:MAG: hypothetical protein WDM78_18000 [Puia sp.]
MDALRPGGTLVIRDGDRDLKKKHVRTKWTEFSLPVSSRSIKRRGIPCNSYPVILSGIWLPVIRWTARSMNDSDFTSNRLFVITHQVKTYEKV